MITLTKQPDSTCEIHGARNCLQYCFDTSDALISSGNRAETLFCFTSVPDIGETIVLETASGTFTVTVGTANTVMGNSITIIGGGNINSFASDLAALLGSTYGLRNYTVFNPTGTGCIFIQSPEEIDEAFVIVTSSNFLAVFLNATGNESTYKEGFRVLYEILCNGQSICDEPWQSPICYNQNGDPQEFCKNISHLVRGLVKTTVPKIGDGIILDQTLCKEIAVRYGCSSTDGECGQPIFSALQTSDPIKIIDGGVQACDNVDICGRFDVPFLSCVPENSYVGCYQWLWIHLGLDDFFETPVTYQYQITYFKDGVQVDQLLTDIGLEGENVTDGCWALPIGCCNFAHTSIDWDSFEVVVLADIPPFGVTPVSLTQKFIKKIKGCCKTEFIFKCSLGGFDTITQFCKVTANFETNAIEICTDTKCEGDKLMEGRVLVNQRSRETITFETELYYRTDDQVRFFEEFKGSREIYIIENGVQKRFSVVPGGIQVWQKDTKIKLTITGYYAFELI